jgi:hypothetical protein
MRWVVAFVLVATGCDRVFNVDVPGVDALPPPPDPDAMMVPVAHDEDLDGLDDRGDNCPTVANAPAVAGAAQDDFDGDGVGDACDPHPITGGDVLVVVEYFVGGTAPVWASVIPDTWTLRTDSLVSPAPPLTGQVGHLLQRPAMQAAAATIDVGYHVLDIGPELNSNHVEVRLDTTGDSAHCRVEESLLDGNSRLEVESSLALVGSNFTPEVVAGQSYVVRLTRDAAEHRCTVQGNVVTTANNDPGGVVVSGAIDLVDTQIEIDYIAIYAVP